MFLIEELQISSLLFTLRSRAAPHSREARKVTVIVDSDCDRLHVFIVVNILAGCGLWIGAALRSRERFTFEFLG